MSRFTTPEAIERERERCRLKMIVYRQKYPERVLATKLRQKQKPDYAEKKRLCFRRWLEKKGHVFTTKEERDAQLANASKKYLAIETKEHRKARMDKAQGKEARDKARAKMLSYGEGFPGALFWSLMSPDGTVYKFKNLPHFIRSNRHLFTDEQLLPVNKAGRTRIEAAIYMLSPRRKHCVEHCHGWRWHIDGKEPASYLATG